MRGHLLMDNKKEKRCIFCRKLLLDETLPICLRCRLQGVKYTGDGIKAFGALLILAIGAKTIIDNTKEK